MDSLKANLNGVFELAKDGGYVMAAIFLLSACLYALALRTYFIGKSAAAPASLVSDGELHVDRLEGAGRFWRGFKMRLDPFAADPSLCIHFIATSKKRFQRALRSQLALLKALAASAPLLGLLGTLVGMIDTFDALSGGREDAAALVADGISKALLTTNAGLVVAIPAVFIAYLSKRKMEQALLVFTALENTQLRQTPPSQ